MKRPIPWTIAAAATGAGLGSVVAASGGGTTIAACVVVAIGGNGAAWACDSRPVSLPQHSLPIRLQACRSVALIGQASERQSGAPDRTAKAAARKTAAAGRRRRQLCTQEVYAQRASATTGSSTAMSHTRTGAAGSVALLGFAVDSLIELAAGVTALWRLSADFDPERRARVERTSLRVIGACFLALAVYVAGEAARSLLLQQRPTQSLPGIALAVASLVAMPLLARAKRRVAVGMGSGALAADAQQTALCGYLSAILLGGLLLNAALGWWWADPLAALCMVPLIIKEGLEGVRGRSSCAGC